MRGLVAAAAIVAAIGAAPPDPFAFFAPSVVVTERDRRHLTNGDPVSHSIPAPKGQVAIFAAVPVSATGDRLAAWTRAISRLKKSDQVPISRRFSDPPRLDDLDGLVFDDDTLDDVRSCRMNDCHVKLTEMEIEHLQAVIAAAGKGWRPALQDALRLAVIARVDAYRASGQLGIPPVSDGSRPVSLHEHFAGLLRASEFLIQHQPDLAFYLGRYPEPPRCALESFLYWSREEIGQTPSYTVTHVAIVRGDGLSAPEVVVIGKQVFATRYTSGSLAVTAMMRDADGRRYLVYVNRTDVDIMEGSFGGLVRWFAERRLKSEVPGVLNGVRKRLESGDPPAD